MQAPPRTLENLASSALRWGGSSWAFLTASAFTLGWMVTGPVFHYSDSWQLAMNTVSSITTFLMVFLLQRSQNKDTLAMQIKLNEIIAAHQGANNRLINIEELSEDEIQALRGRYQSLAAALKDDPSLSNHIVLSPDAAAVHMAQEGVGVLTLVKE